jgi:8-oxo-dGTP pyrophosphatase MutT (NUDIX family)
VRFDMDGNVMADVSEAPFRHRFSTSEYPLGQHTLMAIGFTAGGAELRSPARTFDFVSAEASWEAAGRIAIPLAAAVIVLVAVGTLAPALLGRKRTFKPGEYGSAGGAVCPRCELPYSRSFLSPNLLVGKLERCPHCGKWALVRRASREALEEAEARLQSEGESEVRESISEAERLRRMVDESRFEN